MATKRQKKKAAKKRDMILEIFDKENVSKEIKDEIAELIKCKQNTTWSGYAFTPPGSLFEEIVKRFEKDTDLDLSLPFFISLSMLATILIKKGVKIEIAGRETEPTFWLQLLCDSGAGKTFCLNEIKKSIGHALDQNGVKLDNKKEKFEDSLLWEPNAISVAQFMHEWAGRVDKDGNTIEIEHNRRLMLVDEASDFFEQLKNKKGLLYPMYRNILAAYSHEKIEYATASNGKITVEKPVVNFLGLATPERFIEGISQNDIEGGFYYRFAMLISAEQRSMKGHAIYPSGILDGIEENWKQILTSIVHQTYIVSNDALKYFCDRFDENVSDNNMPRAYIRRMSWLTHKIALIYHLLLGHGLEKEIGIESYRWSERLIAAFQNTASDIIHRKMNTESVQTIGDVQRLINRRKEKGLETTPRDIVLGTKIATKEAELYYRILNS